MTELLMPTQQEFDRRLESGRLTLSLIGMSNMGKSHWSRALARDLNFEHVDCDDLILGGLRGELQAGGHAPTLEGVADWMGLPHEARSPERQQRYLDLETMHMESIIGKIKHRELLGNAVIDTTGSVVHTRPAIQWALSQLSLVVYLKTPADAQAAMFESFVAEPKPVVWGETYKPRVGESPEVTLERCYPELLRERSGSYQLMAASGVTLDGVYVRETLASTEDFLQAIRNCLPVAPDVDQRSADVARVRKLMHPHRPMNG